LYWTAALEHRRRDPDLQLLGRIASSTGGRILQPRESPFDTARPSSYRDVATWAGGMALAMFVLDLAARERIRLQRFTRWRSRAATMSPNGVALP
jgi:hypothetical protein